MTRRVAGGDAFDARVDHYLANLPEWCRQVLAATLEETRAKQADRIRYATAVEAGVDGAREEAWHEQLRHTAQVSPGAMGELVITAELGRPYPRPFALVAGATRKAGQPLATVTPTCSIAPTYRRTIADDVRFARDTIDRLDAAGGYLRR